MGVVLTVNENKTEMIRLVGDKLVKEEAQRNLYVIPPKNGEYEFTITGYALPFEMRSDEYGVQTKTKLELTMKNGQMVQCMFGFSIGPKSNLGEVLRRLGVDMAPDPKKGGWDLDACIGYSGKGYFNLSDKLDDTGKPKYVNLVPKSVEPIGKPEKKYSFDETITDVIPAATASSNGNHAPADDGWE